MKAVIILALLIAGCNGLPRVNKKIESGHAAGKCEFPHMALLLMEMPRGGHAACGGALIDDVHILTAAHCIKHVVSVTAHLGHANYQKAPQVINATRWTIHEGFGYGNNVLNDVAMIRLKKPAILGKCVRPISLPKKDQVFTGRCIAAGWSPESSNQVGGAHLRRTTIRILPTRFCQRRHYGISPGQHICTGDRTGKGRNICSGDSGSPLMCKSGNKYIVAGVASYNFNCASRFGVYANVAGLLDWVKEVQESL